LLLPYAYFAKTFGITNILRENARKNICFRKNFREILPKSAVIKIFSQNSHFVSYVDGKFCLFFVTKFKEKFCLLSRKCKNEKFRYKPNSGSGGEPERGGGGASGQHQPSQRGGHQAETRLSLAISQMKLINFQLISLETSEYLP
jgi:hypothetical protein